jgi:hypothetical protein
LDLEITSLSISALLQLTKINEFDGNIIRVFFLINIECKKFLNCTLKGATSVNFSVVPQTSLEQMISGDMGTAIFSSYYDKADFHCLL